MKGKLVEIFNLKICSSLKWDGVWNKGTSWYGPCLEARQLKVANMWIKKIIERNREWFSDICKKMLKVLKGEASKYYNNNKETEQWKTMDKYEQLERFHNDLGLQFYMYAFMYVDPDTMPGEDYIPATKQTLLITTRKCQIQDYSQKLFWIELNTFRRLWARSEIWWKINEKKPDQPANLWSQRKNGFLILI